MTSIKSCTPLTLRAQDNLIGAEPENFSRAAEFNALTTMASIVTFADFSYSSAEF